METQPFRPAPLLFFVPSIAVSTVTVGGWDLDVMEPSLRIGIQLLASREIIGTNENIIAFTRIYIYIYFILYIIYIYILYHIYIYIIIYYIYSGIYCISINIMDDNSGIYAILCYII